MKLPQLALIAFLILLGASFCSAQAKTNPAAAATVNLQAVKSSPAYAEVLLRKTELLSELEALLIDYTEEFPKVKQLRYESALLQKELERLTAAGAPDASKFSIALGKLMVRKCELNTDLWNLQQQFSDQHADVKRAKRKSELFEAAINEIMQGK